MDHDSHGKVGGVRALTVSEHSTVLATTSDHQRIFSRASHQAHRPLTVRSEPFSAWRVSRMTSCGSR